MNTQTATKALTALAARSATMLPTASPSATAWKKAHKVINGHFIEAHDLDFGRDAWFEVDRSIERLTLAQAVAKVTT